MAPAPAQRSGNQFASFAWQRIALTVPEDWDLVMIDGTARSGHVRLADQHSVRLELHWQDGGAQSVSDTVSAYVDRLARRAAKEGTEFGSQRGLRLASPAGKDVECYRWTADRQVLAMLSRCRDCGRVVHAHVLGERDEKLKGLARTIFSSLTDHAEGDWVPWSFYDVSFRSPAALPLARSTLQSGCIRMAFGRGLTRLEFVRASMADVLLDGRELGDWFTGFYARQLKRRVFAVDEDTVHGHAAVRVSGRPWRLLNPCALFGRRRTLQGACWHCAATNRIMLCCYDGPLTGAGVLEPAVGAFSCCDRK